MKFEEPKVTPQKYLNLYNQSQEKIKNEQIISNSLLKSLIKELRNNGTDFLVDLVVKPFFTKSFFSDKENKIYSNQFFNKMNELFFDGIRWEFESISSEGYDRYGYNIYFKLKEQRYNLFFPYPSNITVDNIRSACYGKYNLTIEKKPSFYYSIVSSYDIGEIKEAIKKESEV